MINKAIEFLGIGKAGKLALMTYYNRNCYPYVAVNRKYKIQPNDEWCAMFTTVIANKCGLGAEKFPYEVSVFYQREWAKKHNKYYTDVKLIKPNDLVVYDWNNNNTYDHVGIVVKVANGLLTVIEGNKNDTVAYRTVSATSEQIDGFISIDYTGKNYAQSHTMPDVDRVAILALRTVIGVYGDGDARRAALGADYDAVQRLINQI